MIRCDISVQWIRFMMLISQSAGVIDLNWI